MDKAAFAASQNAAPALPSPCLQPGRSVLVACKDRDLWGMAGAGSVNHAGGRRLSRPPRACEGVETMLLASSLRLWQAVRCGADSQRCTRDIGQLRA